MLKLKQGWFLAILVILVIGLWTAVIYFILNVESIKTHPCDICQQKEDYTCFSGKFIIDTPSGVKTVKLNLSNIKNETELRNALFNASLG